jgi:hypothetical protein
MEIEMMRGRKDEQTEAWKITSSAIAMKEGGKKEGKRGTPAIRHA